MNHADEEYDPDYYNDMERDEQVDVALNAAYDAGVGHDYRKFVDVRSTWNGDKTPLFKKFHEGCRAVKSDKLRAYTAGLNGDYWVFKKLLEPYREHPAVMAALLDQYGKGAHVL